MSTTKRLTCKVSSRSSLYILVMGSSLPCSITWLRLTPPIYHFLVKRRRYNRQWNGIGLKTLLEYSERS